MEYIIYIYIFVCMYTWKLDRQIQTKQLPTNLTLENTDTNLSQECTTQYKRRQLLHYSKCLCSWNSLSISLHLQCLWAHTVHNHYGESNGHRGAASVDTPKLCSWPRHLAVSHTFIYTEYWLFYVSRAIWSHIKNHKVTPF